MFSSLSYGDRDIEPVIREYLECRHGDIPEGDGRDDCYNCTPRWIERPNPRALPPNPILQEFRIGWRHNIDRRLHAQHYLTYLDGDVYDWRHFSPEVFDHARRVLSKLTALRA